MFEQDIVLPKKKIQFIFHHRGKKKPRQGKDTDIQTIWSPPTNQGFKMNKRKLLCFVERIFINNGIFCQRYKFVLILKCDEKRSLIEKGFLKIQRKLIFREKKMIVDWQTVFPHFNKESKLFFFYSNDKIQKDEPYAFEKKFLTYFQIFAWKLHCV